MKTDRTTTPKATPGQVRLNPEEQAAIKRAIREHRLNQFFWGWFWFGTVELGFRLIGASETAESSSWVTLALFVTSGALALHYQRKVCRIKTTFTFNK